MRRAATAVLLPLFVPILLLAQRHAAEGGSGPSGGYSGSSGSSSSNVSSSSSNGSVSSSSSSGNSHSSSSSSGSSAYSGGSSSSSSSENSHSSSSSSGGSGGSSGSFHSSGSSASSRTERDTSSRTHTGSGVNSASTSTHHESERFSRTDPNFPSQVNSHSASPSESHQWNIEKAAGSTIENPRMLEPLHLSGGRFDVSDAKKTLREGRFDRELRELGLEPNKLSYRQKVSPFRETDEPKEPNWLARLFLGKRESIKAANPEFRPCKLKECKPLPNPPPPPKSPVQKTVCVTGMPDPSNPTQCVPWGYIDHCDHSQCYARLRRIDFSYCEDLRRRLRAAERQVADSKDIQINTCSIGAQSQVCALAKSEYQQAIKEADNFRNQYYICLRSATEDEFRALELVKFDPVGF